MRNTLLILLTGICLLGFSSCSDDDDSTSSPVETKKLSKTLFVFGNVTRSEFTKYNINESGAFKDSVKGVVELAKDTILDNLACKKYVRVVKSDPKVTSYEFYRSSADSSEAFVYSNFINDIVKSMVPPQYSIDLPFILPDMWVKIGDISKTSWTAYSANIKDFVVSSAYGIVVNGVFNLTCSKGITLDMTIDYKTYKAQEFTLLFKFNGKIPNVSDNAEITKELKFYFVENKGVALVKSPQNTAVMFSIPGIQYLTTQFN
jgi:hypothetical protein